MGLCSALPDPREASVAVQSLADERLAFKPVSTPLKQPDTATHVAMGTHARGRDDQSSMPLLKTCQTCFHAKIRCEKTQDSELCDRCLRLGKTCIFKQARRRRNVSRQR